jgi:3'-phosphoadenosine 5'-phosphosulfate sulfotransferase (PAPS reductase)/FAD synthetase
MLDVVCALAMLYGVLRRVVVLHCDLGYIEWPGTARLARRQAAAYGVRFETRSRAAGSLLAQIYERGQWPSARARYCTSAHKRGPGATLITALVDELQIEGRPARVLYCLGFRAEESQARRDAAVLKRDARFSSGRRQVDVWLPIHDWTEAQVWERIRSTGIPYHPAYDSGMSRLSCSLCVLSSRKDLLCAVRLRPELAEEYLRLEGAMSHDFQFKRPLETIVAEAGIGGVVWDGAAELGPAQRLGEGRLTWSRLEQQETGDGTLLLYDGEEEYVTIEAQPSGRSGRLVAVGLETDPVIDPFGQPTRAHIQPGEEVTLGRGRLVAVGTREVGLTSDQERWFREPGLYRCIDRPVALEFWPDLAVA